MSSTAMVHVRVEEEIKAQATTALSAMGLSVSDAVRVLLTRVAAEKRLPFEVRVPNAETRTAMAEAGELPRFRTADELFNDLAQDAVKYTRGAAAGLRFRQDVP